MKKMRRFSNKTASARVIRLSSESRTKLHFWHTNKQKNDPETFLAYVLESLEEYDEALRGLIER